MPLSLTDLAEKYVAEALANDWASSDDPNGVWRRRGSQAADERRLTDLTSARNLTRRLLEGSQFDDGNEYAIGAATNRVNYVVGDAGIKYEIVPARGKQVPPELLAAGADWLDRFREANDLAALERETVWRLDRDGEAFLRLFPCEGCPEVAFVQPERVYPPAGGGEPVSLVSGLSAARAGESVPELVAPWGILRPRDNPRRIVGYWVDRGDGAPVVVDEREIVHLKLNVTSEFERGWPTFEPVRRALLRAEELLVAMTASGKVRAKIALITTIPGWTAAKADSLKAQLTTKYQDQPNGEPPRQETIEELPYGAHLRVRDGTNIAFPPPGLGANEIVEAIQANLRAAGSRLVMPEWMFTLLADAKYANAFVVEAPTLRMFQSLQGLIVQGIATGRYKERTSLIRRAMRMSAERGDLPAEVLTLCEIKATPPSLETRDKSAEASANVAYIGAGVKPVALVQQELGIDPDEARKLAEKYATQPPAAPPTDPAAPPEPVPPETSPPQPDPAAAPVAETVWPYGYCPKCGAKGVARERRPNGNDHCERGCVYPSRDALAQPPNKPIAEALTRIVAEWFAEGGAARAGGHFPDAEHFGLTEEGQPWVSEQVVAWLGEAVKSKNGLVAKKIQLTSSKGKQYEKTVWVKPDELKQADKDAKKKQKEESAKEKKEAAKQAQEARFKVLGDALKDPKSVPPKNLAEALKGMTLSELKAWKSSLGVKGGKTKSEISTKLLDHVKAKKEAIKKAAAELKKKQAKEPPKPAPSEPGTVPVPDESAKPVAPAEVAKAPKTVAPKNALAGAKEAAKGKGAKKPPAKPAAPPAKDLAHATGTSAAPDAPAFGGPKVGEAGGKPSAHIEEKLVGGNFETKPSAQWKADHPHATAKALNDSNAGDGPNEKLPDHTRPPTPDLKTAKYLNNYTWGYDGEMNRALRTTDAPPPGEFGGSPVKLNPAEQSLVDATKGKTAKEISKILDSAGFEKWNLASKYNTGDTNAMKVLAQKLASGELPGKPSKNGPEMHAALQEQFAKAKPFSPPPIAVTRGLVNATVADATRLAQVAEQALATGGTVRMPGYVSTTVGDSTSFTGRVTFKIRAIHGLDMKPYSHYPTENELLLNHNAEYKVRKVEGDYKNNGKVTIYLDQVSGGGASTALPALK